MSHFQTGCLWYKSSSRIAWPIVLLAPSVIEAQETGQGSRK